MIFHDHGTRYLGKMFNPDWMREKGFLDRKGLTARDLVANREKAPLVTIDRNDTVEKAAHIMTENAYSQIPVTSDGRLVGSVNEALSLFGDRQEPRRAARAGRGDHAAGVSLRRHLDERRCAGGDADAG